MKNEYFKWLKSLVCGKKYSKQISYDKLLKRLYEIEFIYFISRDQNRAEDGMDLRYRFEQQHGYFHLKELDGPCSVLEMMVALSIRCEENIMDDPNVGNRTGQWFWNMIVSLGLGFMTDNRFDEQYVDVIVNRFLYREYEPNGKGGLFTIKNCHEDLRDVEIWYQLCWYLDSIA